jgi:cytochrome c553
MKSQLTKAEYDQLMLSDLMAGGKPTLLYRHVSHGQLSVARYSGGARINGCIYVYNAVADELLREDALKELAKIRRDAKKEAGKQVEQKQIGLL